MNPKLAKSEMVYRGLRDKILTGRYVAGYRLVLDQIAREYGVSTVPVREAVRRLEAEKLVSFTPNIGAVVSSVDLEDYTDAMETLAVLEGAATSFAAPLLSADVLEAAARANERMGELALHSSQLDSAEFSKLNRRFHRLLWEPCPNVHLTRMLDQEWNRVAAIRRAQFAFDTERALTSVAEHGELLRLIREGAPAPDIERFARNHKMRTLRDSVSRRVG